MKTYNIFTYIFLQGKYKWNSDKEKYKWKNVKKNAPREGRGVTLQRQNPKNF